MTRFWAHANALAVNLVNPQHADAVLDKIRKAEVPAVFFNREPDLSVLKHTDSACFVGTLAFEAGRMQGELIKQLWDAHPEYDRNKDGVLQYVLFQGNADNPEAIARTEHSVRRAVELGVPMRQLGVNYVCNWDASLATEAMRGALASHGEEVELVLSNNDAMALGTVVALQERGYNSGNPAKFIPVVGVDALPSALEAIRNGTMSATVKQDGDAMAAAIATLIFNKLDKKPFLEGTPYTWDASGLAVRIPYLKAE